LAIRAASGARVGLFAHEHSYPAYVRFSNGASRSQADKAPDARGFAVKLVGVPGKKLIGGLESELTQDLLFINDPALPFRTPEEFMRFQRSAKDGPLVLLPRLIANFGFGRALAILRGALKSPKVKSFATHAFHTGAPIAFGDTAAKLALFPGANAEAPEPGGDDSLRGDLLARLRAGSLSWTLRAQLFSDDQKTPIEDASVEWSGPWLDLGVLTIPRQDPESTRGQEIDALVSRLSFDPWHAIEAHRPLGAIMRARGAVYGASVLARKAAAEPHSVLSLAAGA
ncbi:MAG TPA: hypothetical protein VGM29_11420, partial [Polyangiaceae bacterium]